jgi:hypothetical protein
MKTGFLLILIFLTQNLFAGDLKIQQEVLPDGSVKYIFDENREAMVYSSFSDPLQFNLPIQITENLCEKKTTLQKCSLNVSFSQDHIVLRWTKHPDANRVGEIVKSVFKPSEGDEITNTIEGVFGSSFYTQYLNSDNQDARQFKDNLTCDNFDWLSDNFNENKLLVQSMNSESMNKNVHTDINENITNLSINDVTLLKNENTLQFQNVGKILSTNFLFLLYPAGDISTWHKLNKNGESCQISFSHSIRSAAVGIDLDQNYKKNPNFKPIQKNSIQYIFFQRQTKRFFDETKNIGKTYL